jgi:hypothetical protein
MLPGFAEHTEPLTDKEKLIVPLFIKGFAKHYGRQRAITNKQIIEALQNTNELKLNEATVRKIINHIRKENLVPGLIAGSDGYYVSTDATEVENYIKSLTGRANEIKRIADCMKMYLNTLA